MSLDQLSDVLTLISIVVGLVDLGLKICKWYRKSRPKVRQVAVTFTGTSARTSAVLKTSK